MRLISRAIQQMPRRSACCLALSLLRSFLEGTSLLLIVPVLGSLGVGTASSSAITNFIMHAFAAIGVPYTLGTTLGFILLVGVITAAVGFCQSWLADSMYRAFVSHLQIDTYKALINATPQLLSRQRQGETFSILTKFIEQSGNGFIMLIRLITGSLILTGLIVVAMAQAWQFVVATLALCSAAAWPMRQNAKVVHRMGLECHRQVRELASYIGEHLRLLPTIKAFGAQNQSLKVIASHIKQAERLMVNLRRRMAVVRSLLDIMMVTLLCLAIYLGAVVFGVTVERLLLLTVIFIRLVPNLLQIVTQTQQIPLQLVAFDAVTALSARCRSSAEPKGGVAPPSRALKTGIELIDASVSAGSTLILDRVSLTVSPRSLTVLVGQSGAGKSTIVSAVLGLTPLTSGRIEIEGTDLSLIDKHEWRRRIGYVSQDVVLFGGTIRENLAFAAPEADETVMRAALEDAGLGDFIRALPLGLDTHVGEQATLVSGGERQRLALARALVRQPVMLILDEPTSALDRETMEQILVTLERIRKDVTILVIAHDLKMVRSADMIYLIDRGRVTEAGKWSDLIERQGQFFRHSSYRDRINPEPNQSEAI